MTEEGVIPAKACPRVSGDGNLWIPRSSRGMTKNEYHWNDRKGMSFPHFFVIPAKACPRVSGDGNP